ncbi:AcrR family transcriptional regulator [Arthrobacter sp. CAN_A214]|uniref:TetR/AcrR family transcriptional regulator n=1 Tax=Arthrobacter sp. CAN_A214 TaxID=2787720 RepID=UPI0018C93B6D
MTDSAITAEGGLREQKRTRTRAAIVAAARSLTLEHGLGGFTIEQVCAQADISRRTFFNYFPTKEDAVLAYPDDGLPRDLVDQFLRGAPDGHRPPLLDALSTLFGELGDRLAISGEEYLAVSDLIRKEPHLIARIFTKAEVQQEEMTGLIAQREGLEPDDRRARLATFLMGGLARRSVDEFFSLENAAPYRDILRQNIAALAALFDIPALPSPTSRKDAS